MLRNAFDELSTESTLGRILEALRTIIRQQTYARTPQDQLRVNVDNQISASIYQGNNGSQHMQGALNNPALWSNTSWNMMDARFPYGEQLNADFILSTRNRWTIT